MSREVTWHEYVFSRHTFSICSVSDQAIRELINFPLVFCFSLLVFFLFFSFVVLLFFYYFFSFSVFIVLLCMHCKDKQQRPFRGSEANERHQAIPTLRCISQSTSRFRCSESTSVHTFSISSLSDSSSISS